MKVAVEVPRALHRDLLAYAEILAHQSGQAVSEPTKLIAPMLARFMATDRAFAKKKGHLTLKMTDDSQCATPNFLCGHSRWSIVSV